MVAVILLTACGGSAAVSSVNTMVPLDSQHAGGAGKVGHIVIVVQENRTPDNLFQGLANADIQSWGLNNLGQKIPLQPIPLNTTFDLGHTHNAFKKIYDGGKMDGANLEFTTCGTSCPYQNVEYGYVPASDDQPYLDLASQYTFGDRMFQTNQGPSYPAHQYLIAGTSEPSVGSPLEAAENTLPLHVGAGCTAPSNSRVAMIDAAGHENTTMYPCFEHPTLMDLLDQQGISWKYYANNTNGIWTAPNSIKHLRAWTDWKNVDTTSADVLKDIAAGKLAQVTWVIPKPLASDHAGSTDGSGPSWVASVVNALGQSSYWNDTVIFVVWDDWGGWYDHVPPPNIYTSYELGLRVPLIVVSPYAKAHYVSHTNYEFGSILKFTEETFGLGSLGYTDVRANDMSDCFNFAQAKIPFKKINAPLNASFFLNNAKKGTDIPEDY
jgi:phospholipase C